MSVEGPHARQPGNAGESTRLCLSTGGGATAPSAFSTLSLLSCGLEAAAPAGATNGKVPLKKPKNGQTVTPLQPPQICQNRAKVENFLAADFLLTAQLCRRVYGIEDEFYGNYGKIMAVMAIMVFMAKTIKKSLP